MTPDLVVDSVGAVLAVVAFSWIARTTIDVEDLRDATRDGLVAAGRFAIVAALGWWVVREALRSGSVPSSAWATVLCLLWLPALAGYFFEYRARIGDDSTC